MSQSAAISTFIEASQNKLATKRADKAKPPLGSAVQSAACLLSLVAGP